MVSNISDLTVSSLSWLSSEINLLYTLTILSLSQSSADSDKKKDELIELTQQIKYESQEAMNSMDDDHLNYPAELIYKICKALLKYQQLKPYAWEYRNARGLNFTKDKKQIERVKEYCPDINIIELFKLDTQK